MHCAQKQKVFFSELDVGFNPVLLIIYCATSHSIKVWKFQIITFVLNLVSYKRRFDVEIFCRSTQGIKDEDVYRIFESELFHKNGRIRKQYS